MYLHPAFSIGLDEAMPILEKRSFGQFVVPTRDTPFGVHVPFLVQRTRDDKLLVEFHVARANPIYTHIGKNCRSLLICEAGDAYISPDWYGTENQVPTWTYVAVHLKGTANVVANDRILNHVDRLSAHFEQRLLPKMPWTSAKMSSTKRAAMLRAIVLISMDVDVVEAQKKLGQHKSHAERLGAIEGLMNTGNPDSTVIASMMSEELEKANKNTG